MLTRTMAMEPGEDTGAAGNNGQVIGGKDFTATFECFGLEVHKDRMEGLNVACDCPLCGKPHHFYLNVSTGQWDCKSCLKGGSHFKFLEEITDHWYERTTDEQFAKLAASRGLPVAAFEEFRVGYNEVTGDWMIPVYDDKGKVRDVRRYNGKAIKSTTGCFLQLFGLYKLAHTKEASKRRVWVAEGEWDAIALTWLFNQCQVKDIAVGVPGAGTFKQEWVPWFKNLDVIWAYDNDGPGDEGSLRASQKTNPATRRERFICWPELTLPAGWDVRDHIVKGIKDGLEPSRILTDLELLLANAHRRKGGRPIVIDSPAPQNYEGPATTFVETLDVFGKYIELDKDFKDALAIAYATYLSTTLPDNPLWFYIIGVPGSGKGVILDSMSGLDGCSYHSSLTPKGLVSGFHANPDPSLIPQLNGKTAVFKDGTELLAIHPDARREIYAVLRGAYDGRVDKQFGNGVIRRYLDLHFSVLVGITPAIHADNEASMGERFLKFEMREQSKSVVAKLYRACDNSQKELNISEELKTASVKFLSRTLTKAMLPKIPMQNVHRIVAMSLLMARLRAQVHRDMRDRDLKFRGFYETGTRIVSQMTKLAQVLAVVFDKPEVDDEVCRVLRKVMADTCVGFHVDIVKAIVRSKNEGLTASELSATSKISLTTLYKRLDDMEDLSILRTERHAARKGDIPVKRYFLTDEVAAFWEQSVTGKPVLEQAKAAGGNEQ